jgi:hypothetical protein
MASGPDMRAYASERKPGSLYYRASFPQDRMTHLPDENRLIHRSKNNLQEKIFEPFSSDRGAAY